eukprot:g17837.t1
MDNVRGLVPHLFAAQKSCARLQRSPLNPWDALLFIMGHPMLWNMEQKSELDAYSDTQMRQHEEKDDWLRIAWIRWQKFIGRTGKADWRDLLQRGKMLAKKSTHEKCIPKLMAEAWNCYCVARAVLDFHGDEAKAAIGAHVNRVAKALAGRHNMIVIYSNLGGTAKTATLYAVYPSCESDQIFQPVYRGGFAFHGYNSHRIRFIFVNRPRRGTSIGGDALSKSFLENSTFLPGFVAKCRGSHVRSIVCDKEERGCVWLRPDEVMDVTLLLASMHIEEDTSTAGAWNGERIKGPAPQLKSEDIVCGIGALTSVLQATLDVADSNAARKVAVEKLDLMCDNSKREASKQALLDRCQEVASKWSLPLGTYDSLYEFLACSLGNYKTASQCVKEVMGSSLCRMSGSETEAMQGVLKRLKTRGFVENEENSAPITLMDIVDADRAGLVEVHELVMMLLAFYLAMRPGEIKKLACDYVSRVDVPIVQVWDKKDLTVNFKKTSIKSNKHKCIRAKCACEELKKNGLSTKYCVCWCKNKMRPFSTKHDLYTISVKVFSHIGKVGGHSYRVGCTLWLFKAKADPLMILIHCRWQALGYPGYDDFAKAYKIMKRKEGWCYGRELVTDPKNPKCKVVHYIVAMGTSCPGLGNLPLLTRPQRDEWLSKHITNTMHLSEEDANQITGEVLLDTKEVSTEVAATTYSQRFGRYMQNDWDNTHRESERRQERLHREKEEIRKDQKEREEKAARELERLIASMPYGKGGKKGKGKKGGKAAPGVCHQYLKGSCRFANCRFKHPANESESRAAEAKKRSAELFSEIQESIRKPKVCGKLGLWESLGADYHKTDPESWRVWHSGLECIGKCRCPNDWEDKKGVKPAVPASEFKPSKIVQDVVNGVHKKPRWGDALIKRCWDDTLKETRVVPELGYKILTGPLEIKSIEEVRFGFRRFPREQKAGKVRLIDPAVSAGDCSLLDKVVPIPTPHDILVSGAVAHDPEMRDKCVVQHTRRIVKKCRKAEKKYEEQLLQYFKGERKEIDADLLKKGASQPKWGEKVAFNDACPHVAKKRRREAGEKVDLELVVVDVAKCYKNIMVKMSERKCNRLLAYDPEVKSNAAVATHAE